MNWVLPAIQNYYLQKISRRFRKLQMKLWNEITLPVFVHAPIRPTTFGWPFSLTYFKISSSLKSSSHSSVQFKPSKSNAINVILLNNESNSRNWASMKYKRFFLQINRWEWATFKLGYVRHEGIVTENITKQNYFVYNQIIYYHYDTLFLNSKYQKQLRTIHFQYVLHSFVPVMLVWKFKSL